MATERNNILAGVLVLAAIGGFSGALWGWKAWQSHARNDYVVRFTAEQGVYGLHPGSLVFVGGIIRGEVISVDAKTDDARGVIDHYEALVRVEREVPVCMDSVFEATGAGINGEGTLAIREIGSTRAFRSGGASPETRALAPEMHIFQAVDPPPYQGYVGSKASKPLAALIGRWSDETPDSLRGRLGTALEEIPTKTRAFKKSTEELKVIGRADIDRWREQYAAVTKEAEAAFAKLGAGKNPSPEAAIPQMNAAAEEARNLPIIETGRIEPTAKAFDSAVAAVKELGAKSGGLRDMMEDTETSLGRVGADASIASQELSATYSEAVTSPWRLFGSPGKAELEADARIGLVRAYAESAAAHQRAMKGIEDALKRDAELLAKEPGLAELLRARLQASNALFEAQSARMEELLLGPAATPSPASSAAPAPTAP
jgi:hypothetical protein